MRTSAPSSIESIEKYLASGMRYRTSLHRENGQGLRRGRVRDHRDARYAEAASPLWKAARSTVPACTARSG